MEWQSSPKFRVRDYTNAQTHNLKKPQPPGAFMRRGRWEDRCSDAA